MILIAILKKDILKRKIIQFILLMKKVRELGKKDRLIKGRKYFLLVIALHLDI